MSILQLIRIIVENTAGREIASPFIDDPKRHRILECVVNFPENVRIPGPLPDKQTTDILVASYFTNVSIPASAVPATSVLMLAARHVASLRSLTRRLFCKPSRTAIEILSQRPTLIFATCISSWPSASCWPLRSLALPKLPGLKSCSRRNLTGQSSFSGAPGPCVTLEPGSKMQISGRYRP